MKPTTVVAIGGNSLIRSKERSSFQDQMEAVAQTCRHIAGIAAAGEEVVVTHGNGPQVGFLLIRSHLSRIRLPESPLDSCNAQTQAEIGYMVQQSLANEFQSQGIEKGVTTVVTQVRVNPNDPAFANPSKPVGPFYTKREAAGLQKDLGWTMKEDAGRGFRRLVPSPRPVEVVEKNQIAQLVSSGNVVIACGGGGIPVVMQDGKLKGVAAVIDKDHASAVLAGGLGAHRLVISTAVEQVYANFGRPNQEALDKVDTARMRKLLDEGHFPAGSMGPKVQASLDFLGRGGKEVVITDPEHIMAAVKGQAGTRIRG